MLLLGILLEEEEEMGKPSVLTKKKKKKILIPKAIEKFQEMYGENKGHWSKNLQLVHTDTG